ncbi:MAG: cupin domain-containing protein [Phycisphaerae bacterium]|nr:cupin domain-containing protein [Phycisphaerae bacterium]
MQIKTIESLPQQKVEMEGANGCCVRVLFGPKDNAPTFAMRQFEIAPGGNTPLHTHDFEHQVVVLKGTIIVESKDGPTETKPGDVIMAMPNELHQFKNPSETESASMLCFVPIEYQP